MFWWIVGSVVVLVLFYLARAYNQLVSLNKRADGAWSDIDVQLKRRWAWFRPWSRRSRVMRGMNQARWRTWSRRDRRRRKPVR